MKLATYQGELLTVDFGDNTITFKIDGDFKVQEGNYFIFSEKELQNFVDKFCEKQWISAEDELPDSFNGKDDEFSIDILIKYDWGTEGNITIGSYFKENDKKGYWYSNENNIQLSGLKVTHWRHI